MEEWFRFHHITWAVKRFRPAIRPGMEALLYKVVKARGEALGATVYAVNGTANHVHVVACFPESINLPYWITQIKRGATYALGREFPESPVEWENGHSFRVFGRANLEVVLDYVQRQKEYHAIGKTYNDFEPNLPVPGPMDDVDAWERWDDRVGLGDVDESDDLEDWDDPDESEDSDAGDDLDDVDGSEVF